MDLTSPLNVQDQQDQLLLPGAAAAWALPSTCGSSVSLHGLARLPVASLLPVLLLTCVAAVTH